MDYKKAYEAEHEEKLAYIKMAADLLNQVKELNDKIASSADAFTKRIEELTRELNNTQELLAYYMRDKYCPSSEKKKAVEGSNHQLTFAEIASGEDTKMELEPEAAPAESSDAEVSEEPAEKKERTPRKKSPKEEMYKNVRQTVKDVYVSDDKAICPKCGAKMEHVGYKYDHRVIVFHQAYIEIIKYYVETVKCPDCDKNEAESVMVTAEAPKPLIPHSDTSESLMAYVMYEKFCKMSTYYREEMGFKQLGLPLSRSTMSRLLIKCAFELLKPVYDRMHELLILRDIVHADETPALVLHETRRKGSHKSYLWAYLSVDDIDTPPIVLFDNEPGRNGDYATEFLKGFKGYLQCDGYSGYNELAKQLTRIGCLAHLRRKFIEAADAARDTGHDPGPAKTGYEFCDRIFDYEAKYKNLSPDERKKERLSHEEPVLDDLFAWAKKQNPVGGSKFAKAITYTINQEQLIRNYLLDGRIKLTNNAAETAIKSFVMARKNFLFHDTDKGAEATAIVLSLIETAKANELKIQDYLELVLKKMSGLVYYSSEDITIDDLLPWSDLVKKSLAEKEAERLAEVKAINNSQNG